MKRFTSTLALILLLVGGCDMLNINLPCFFFGGECPTETGSAKLIRFDSEQDLLDYFREQIANGNNRSFGLGNLLGLPVPLESGFDRAAIDLAPAPTADGDSFAAVNESASPDAATSQTTVQEIGVDEADVVKTDGEFLYILSGNALRIVSINPTSAIAQTSEFELPGGPREMYLYDNRVIALTNLYGNPFFGGDFPFILEDFASDGGRESASSDFIGLPEPSLPKTIVTVIDTSDPTNPTLISETKFEGTLSSSRMIGGMLYLVIGNQERQYFDFMPMFREQVQEPQTLDIETLLPGYERTEADGQKTEGDVLTWEEVQRPTDPDGYGVVSVVSMDIDNGGAFTAEGIVAEPGLVYASTDAIYLTDSNFDFFGARQTADIYKFAFQNGRAVPVATGTVPGRILNQYAMGEYNGFLRVATTVNPRDFRSAPHNDLYVLEQQGEELVTVGSIVGMAPGETIQSARFVGDRGFLVTFEQIDPLFTLDLSDPRNPRTVGELKVPGFSTFIVPMDENNLLTVGQYIPDGRQRFGAWGVQLSIFDVTDFANPTLKHSVIIGEETGASSEALYNPKAFTYFAEAGLLALPVSIFEDSPSFFFDDFVDETPRDVEPVDVEGGVVSGGEPEEPIFISDPPPGVVFDPAVPSERGGFDGLYVYRVSADTGFSKANEISTRFNEAGFFGGSYTRGVFIGDDVMAISDVGIRGTTVGVQEAPPFELFLGTPFDTIFTDAVSPERN